MFKRKAYSDGLFESIAQDWNAQRSEYVQKVLTDGTPGVPKKDDATGETLFGFFDSVQWTPSV